MGQIHMLSRALREKKICQNFVPFQPYFPVAWSWTPACGKIWPLFLPQSWGGLAVLESVMEVIVMAPLDDFFLGLPWDSSRFSEKPQPKNLGWLGFSWFSAISCWVHFKVGFLPTRNGRKKSSGKKPLRLPLPHARQPRGPLTTASNLVMYQ